MTRFALPFAALGAMLLAACAEQSTETTAADQRTPSLGVRAATTYTVTDFSSSVDDDSYAWGINDKKVVVGWTNIWGGGTHGWVMNTPGMPAWLQEPRHAIGSQGWAISNTGMVAGTVIFALGRSLPAFWPSKTSLPVAIPLPPGALTGDAFGVNNLGQVAGTYRDASNLPQAFVWDQATNITTTLGTFGGASSQGDDINDRGQVIGCADASSGQPLAFMWTTGGGMRLLDPGPPTSCARGLNSRGDAAGWDEIGLVDSAAVFPACCGVVRLLPRRYSTPTLTDLNDNLVAAGSATLTASGVSYAMAVDQSLLMTTLPLLGGTSESHAFGINNCGAIVGWAIVNGQVRSLMWRPPGC